MKTCRRQIQDIYSVSYIMDLTDKDTIFKELAKKNDDTPVYPKVADFINADNYKILNQDYYISHSAEKYVSPLFEKLFDFNDDLSKIAEYFANLIYNRFGEKWKRIYDALMTQYNPLENYSMEEVRTPDLTTEETQNEKTDLTTERTTHAENSYKGFNANDPVLVNQTDGSENVNTTGAKLDNEVSKTSTNTGTETLTRAGNIGVTTSQQMLESEFKVRQYDFYQMVYNDIDSVLCLSIY